MNKQEATEFAKNYLSDLLSFFGINVEVVASTEDDVIELNVPSSELNSLLIGRNAETLRSLQYLVSTVLRNKEADIWRVNIDIADYKRQRAERLAVQAREWIEGVRKTGNSYVAQLNAADRRIVHQVATEFDDIITNSEGEGRERAIVISQQPS
jgi:spoIIIJ-associated protein